MNLVSCEPVIPHWHRCSKKSWLLNAAPPFLVLGADGKKSKTAPNSQLGFSDWRRGCLNFTIRREWKCFTLRAVTPVEDEIPSSQDAVQERESTVITQFTPVHKDLSSLPKPLSAISLYPRDGTNVRVAYQGIPGAYSEAAALKAFPESETVPCDEFEAVFKAAELWLVDKAVLPIECSVDGSIHRNYDLLIRHRLHIVGEVQLIVDHCLLGLPGVRKEELKHVLSHPQALEQCEIILNKLGVTNRISSVDTAVAAQVVVSEGVRETGAIASARAAEIYGLEVLAEGIQDYYDNITRFLILAREPIIPGTEGSYKTSIVFTLGEGPGVLFKALGVFSMRDITLSKIESRPQKRWPLGVVDGNTTGARCFEYLFYIDFEASMAEPRAQFALGHLQEFAKFIRVLGCYPKDTSLYEGT